MDGMRASLPSHCPSLMACPPIPIIDGGGVHHGWIRPVGGMIGVEDGLGGDTGGERGIK